MNSPIHSGRRPGRSADVNELAGHALRQPQRIGISRNGMVSSQHYLATNAGVQMLAAGGNAVDAAVATALALGVCEPNASGLGGQTMMLIHLAKTRRTIALDGSSRAPHRAIPSSIPEEERRRGYRATTVPTTPRVLSYALECYGNLSWKQVLQPAIKLAEEGFPVSELLRALTRRVRRNLRAGTAASIFLKEGRRTYRAGETLRQAALAETLKRLARRGIDDFYRGRIARLIHRDMVAHGGLIRRDDLAQVQPPIERRPIACWFEGKRLMTFPPPGAGRTLIEMLNIAAELPRETRNLDRPRGALMMSKIMQQAYRDRRDRPYDPSFYAQVSDRRMVSSDYAGKVALRLRRGGETTHLSVMDKFGNAVGLTQSIEQIYGSCCACQELGFLYNNYLMAFEHEDIGHPYFLRPNAVPWASVAPTIIFKERRPWLVIGSPGGDRISPTIFQVLLRLRRQSPFAAVDAPRLYCSLENKVYLEASRMRDDIPAALSAQGYEVERRGPYSFYLGCVQLVIRDNDTFIGVADPRRDGEARGPSV